MFCSHVQCVSVPILFGMKHNLAKLTGIFVLHQIIIIIIKKGQQCKDGREWYTPYQSEDPSPTTPTYRQKEEKGKESRRL